jgi:DnaK suppressor protein
MAKRAKKAAAKKSARKSAAVTKTKRKSATKVVAKSRSVEKIASKAKASKPASAGKKPVNRNIGADIAPAQIASSASVISTTAAGSSRGNTMVAKDDVEYLPKESEAFMNERQKDYFRRKLLQWKEDILRESRETLAALQTENENHPDLADRASSETDRAIELRARDRQRKLISKIDAALNRIEDGTYGYCEETGEPISLKRLDARPIATLSIEAQERHERRERVYRDD